MPYTKKYEKTLYSKKWLRSHYITEGWSAKKIAVHLDCNPTAVVRRLKRFGIRTRSLSEVQKLAPHPGSNAPRPRKGKNTIHNSGWLKRHYVEMRWNASEIARCVGVSVPSVIWALNKAGIPVRDISESKKGRKPRGQAIVGTCSVCAEPAGEINHKDRDPTNNKRSNREPLCRSCHATQHRLEEMMALNLLTEHTDFTLMDIHQLAREKLLGQKAPTSHPVERIW